MNTSMHRTAIESSDRPLAFEIVVLDLDGTMTQQTRLLQRYCPKVIPLQQRYVELRDSCPSDTMDSLRAYVASQVDLQKPRIALYGTGNSHHLASLWISLLNEPVTVIGLGSFSDCVRTIPGYCWLGSWAVLAANLPHVQKLVVLGGDRHFALALHREFDGMAMQPDGSVMTSATWKTFRDRSDVEAGMNAFCLTFLPRLCISPSIKTGCKEGMLTAMFTAANPRTREPWLSTRCWKRLRSSSSRSGLLV